MQIVAAVFAEPPVLHPAPGGSTRIDLNGIHFSAPAPGPFPATVSPHLVVLLRNGPGDRPDAALEVTFHLGDEQIARNVQPVSIEPGRFAYRLVRAELVYPGPATVEARCRVDLGDPVVVPYSLLEPVDPAEG